MSPFILLSLLGMSLLSITFMDNDDDAGPQNEDDGQPDPVTEPDPVTGSEGPDTGSDPEQPADLLDMVDPPEPVTEPVEDQASPFDLPDPTGETFGTANDDDFGNSEDTEGRYYDLQEGRDRVEGGSGDDTITGSGIMNTILGGEGDDLIVMTGEGFNTLYGEGGDDTIQGGDLSDRIRDLEGANLIDTGDGQNSISVSAESTITGGSGAETYNLWFDTTSEDAGLITNFDAAQGDTLSTSYLELGPDTEGTVEARALDDDSGIELYFGDKVLMTVVGASVDDFDEDAVQLRTGGGTYTATDGDDGIYTSDLAETVNAGAGDDYISGGINRDTGPDLLDGGEGNDTIIARGASDGQYGGNPDPEVYSTILEPNVMIGGAGDDLLVSQYDNTMTGGEGEDTFAVQNWTYSNAPPLITDFSAGEDVIYIDPFINQPDDTRSVPDDLSIAVWEDGTGADLMFDGNVIARVAGGQDMTLDDVRVASMNIYTDLLGFH